MGGNKIVCNFGMNNNLSPASGSLKVGQVV